jgi:2-hydroxycyclohexanecarboxyl-CoA dehydrogenase
VALHGGVVTTARSDVDAVVTEHGVAALAGCTVAERARHLVAVAAPQHREELESKVLEVNFKGQLRVVKAVLPGMLERGFGRIINIGSDAGRVGSSLEAVYSGAKGGVIAFTKTLAREVAAQGITANTVCPGLTDTPALRTFADGAGQDAEKVIAGMVRAVPMKRLGTPDDIGPAVAFLASDEAGFITGQTLSVSGGLTMA